MIDVVRILRETFVARAEHHPTLGSTNDQAARCAARGVKELPLLIVADEQTAGRGRGAKRWWTGRGALAVSLLVEAETVAAERLRSPLAALAVAAAVADTVAPLLPNHRVGINWPNDVMCEEKVSGTVSSAEKGGQAAFVQRPTLRVGARLRAVPANGASPPFLRASWPAFSSRSWPTGGT